MAHNSRLHRQRGVSLFYGAVSGLLLVVVATVALVLAPPSPPSVAEFAPTADKTIDGAPRAQSSRFGAGDGGACAVGQVGCESRPEIAATTTSASPESPAAPARTVVKPRVRRCVGDPPRQTEDPQSPPCVNYWQGDNGGTTWRGVTRDEIVLAVPTTYVGREVELFVEFFNRRFEFYGRKLRIIRFNLPAESSSEVQRAAAVGIDERGAFAALGTQAAGRVFYDELAARRIIGVHREGMSFTEDDFGRWHPYVWSYPPALDTFQRNQGEWICRGLAGRLARFAGPDLLSRPRAFGLVVQDRPLGAPPDRPQVGAIVDRLERCGARPERTANVSSKSQDGPDQLTMGDLRTAGVTSIACYCDGNRLVAMQGAASKIGYFPEWLLTPYYLQDEDLGGAVSPPEQRTHSFGLTWRNRVNENSSSPFFWAGREVDASYDFHPGALTSSKTLEGNYQALLLLSSGIQTAGPTLTPLAFAQGLARTVFPNPGAAGPPYYQATVGFVEGGHTMIRDFAAIWFDDRAPSYERAGAGAYCYVERGARWSVDSWPGREPAVLDRSQPCLR